MVGGVTLAGCSGPGSDTAADGLGADWEPAPEGFGTFYEWLPELEDGSPHVRAIDLAAIRGGADIDATIRDWAHLLGTHDYFGAPFDDLGAAIQVAWHSEGDLGPEFQCLVYPGRIDPDRVHELLFQSDYHVEDQDSYRVFRRLEPSRFDGWRGIAVSEDGVIVFRKENAAGLRAMFEAAAGERARAEAIRERWEAHRSNLEQPLVLRYPDPLAWAQWPPGLGDAVSGLERSVLGTVQRDGAVVKTVRLEVTPAAGTSITDVVPLIEEVRLPWPDYSGVEADAVGDGVIEYTVDRPAVDADGVAPASSTIRANAADGELLLRNLAGEPCPLERLRVGNERDNLKPAGDGTLDPGSSTSIDVSDVTDVSESVSVFYALPHLEEEWLLDRTGGIPGSWG